MAVNVLFWKPLACFDTFFNKMAHDDLGDYFHVEVDFVMSKRSGRKRFLVFPSVERHRNVLRLFGQG